MSTMQKSAGNKADQHDYSPIMADYLEKRYSITIRRIKRNTLMLPSGTIIHTKRSSEHNVWYGLDKTTYDEFITEPSLWLALSLGGPAKTFVLPRAKVREIFEGQPTIGRPGRITERWMIRIKEINHH